MEVGLHISISSHGTATFSMTFDLEKIRSSSPFAPSKLHAPPNRKDQVKGIITSYACTYIYAKDSFEQAKASSLMSSLIGLQSRLWLFKQTGHRNGSGCVSDGGGE